MLSSPSYAVLMFLHMQNILVYAFNGSGIPTQRQKQATEKKGKIQ